MISNQVLPGFNGIALPLSSRNWKKLWIVERSHVPFICTPSRKTVAGPEPVNSIKMLVNLFESSVKSFGSVG